MTQMDQNDHFCMPGMLGHVSDLCLRQKTGVSWSLRPKFDMKKVKNEFVFCFEISKKTWKWSKNTLKRPKVDNSPPWVPNDHSEHAILPFQTQIITFKFHKKAIFAAIEIIPHSTDLHENIQSETFHRFK